MIQCVRSLKLGDYLSGQAHKPCTISHILYGAISVPTSITVDPFLKRLGSDVYDVLTSDEENDELTFTSHVENSYVPLDVNSGM